MDEIKTLFDPFVGPNNEFFPVSFEHTGPFSFRKHLYKPLSKELWDDLVCKLKPARLVVCLGYPFNVYIADRPNECSICLDEYGYIQDIFFNSWYR